MSQERFLCVVEVREGVSRWKGRSGRDIRCRDGRRAGGSKVSSSWGGQGTLIPENWRDVPTVYSGTVKIQTQLPSRDQCILKSGDKMVI